jgi:DNA-binding transcriptional MocR family regulator
MVVAEAIARPRPAARAAVVTPAHQSPLCVSLSLPRRLALLDWAARNDAWIIEDDYDGEYRYVSRPLPALKSLDRDGRVLYAGTFSKVLFPSLRLAYLVVPEAQVERFEQVSQAFAGGSPTSPRRSSRPSSSRRAFRAPHPADAQALRRAPGRRRRRGWKACWATICGSIRSRAGCT